MTYNVLSGITPAFGNYNVAGLGWPVGNPSVIVPYSYKGIPFPAGVHRATVPLWNALLDGLTGPLGVQLMNPGCWGYNDRSITGGGSPSFHAAGLALDVNAPSNPYYASGGNHPHTIPDAANALARSLGMEWGGGWTSPVDYMHFEIHLTPAQVQIVAGRLGSTPAQGGDVQLPTIHEGDGIKGAAGGRGTYHWAVESAQALLNIRGLATPALVVDGQFGPKTTASVKALQTRWKLPVTGIIDDQTWPFVIWNVAPDYA
jgi:hypothetical protein